MSSLKPKALWLTSSYPRFQDDSASIFLRNLAISIDKKKYQLHILAPDHELIDQSIKDDGIHFHSFTYCYPRSLQKLAYGSGILPNLKEHPWLMLQVPFFMVAMFLSACHLIIKLKPAIIHAHWAFPQGTMASLLGKLFNIPVIITVHGGDAFALQGSILLKLKVWGIKNCAAWTSNTSATAKAVGQLLPQLKIIPMGINYKKFSSGNGQALRSKISQETLILLFVGRLVEKKGVKDLITAYSLFSESYQKTTLLWIIGDGSERRALETLSQSLNITRNVTFLGKIPNVELPDFYAAADIFIAPSITDSFGDTEGQGVILLEAMASAIPIISTNTGGISEIVNNGKNGILVTPQKPEELKKAIDDLLRNSDRLTSLSEAGKNTAQNFDWEHIGKKFSTLYNQLIKCQSR